MIEVARCRLPGLGGVTGLGLEVAARLRWPWRCEPASGRRWPDPAWPGARRTAAWALLGCWPLCVVRAEPAIEAGTFGVAGAKAVAGKGVSFR